VGFGDIDDIIKGLMASLSVWQLIISCGCKEIKETLTQNNGVLRLKDQSLIYFIL
jgi:hypothetical protein